MQLHLSPAGDPGTFPSQGGSIQARMGEKTHKMGLFLKAAGFFWDVALIRANSGRESGIPRGPPSPFPDDKWQHPFGTALASLIQTFAHQTRAEIPAPGMTPNPPLAPWHRARHHPPAPQPTKNPNPTKHEPARMGEGREIGATSPTSLTKKPPDFSKFSLFLPKHESIHSPSRQRSLKTHRPPQKPAWVFSSSPGRGKKRKKKKIIFSFPPSPAHSTPAPQRPERSP